MKQPLISFVTHGRNDGFMGDFLWRVATCINQIARNYAALGRLDDIEILIGDWGSENKTMREELVLEPAARRVTRFCTVPPAVAARLNQDGDYGYSPAANIPIRRATGKFIFSMDSDAWMPLKTADYLLQIADGKNPTGLDLDKSFFWASRQHIPFPFISTSPTIEALDRYLVEQRDKLFWTGKCNMQEFRGGAVAIFAKRELFQAIRGYNEALVHWGWHDIDIHTRMAMTFKPNDLWNLGAEMFHMEHYPKRGGEVAGGRKMTPQILPTKQIVNGPDWGAINDPVDVAPAPGELLPVIAQNTVRPRNIVISGTNFWNPGDDFVRDGVIRVLHELFPGEQLNFLFYNFNADFFPQSKFAGIGNHVSQGDLDQYREHIDLVVIAGLSAGEEIKDLYRWVVANNLASKVWLLGAGYENGYVEQHIGQEPEATIFKQAQVVTGRTAKTPEFIQKSGIPYHHINCPAILSVPAVKNIPAGKRIERIGFSIQLPTETAVVNHGCARAQYELAVTLLRELAQAHAVEVIAHHKSEYFHFLNLLRGENIPVIFSSFYQDLHQIYPRYDLIVTTRLHSSLFANGHGIPGIIINDTDRHTHTLDGFLHSMWVNGREKFNAAFERWKNSNLAAIAAESARFKDDLLARYVNALRPIAAAETTFSQPAVMSNNTLPVNFFTIVLNGQPFIQHHIEQLRQLPFGWHWHIVEGVAELNHDTAWSKASGGKIPAELHRGGLSVDGTTEYLDALKAAFPENVSIYRPAAGKFWDGKREMVNAPLANLKEESLLWQIDADELWTATQIIRTRALFLAHPEKSAAYFFCHYFVGPELIITSRDTYGNHSSYEWLRVWRYLPGDNWAAHEPPRLHRGQLDVAALNAFRQTETGAMGLVFQHYAYATEAQLQFKESYYGYANAVAQWKNLQATKQFPVKLAEYFTWVTDAAMVNTAKSAGIQRLVPDAWLGLNHSTKNPMPATNLDGANRILFVRTDSIGDAVLASAMIEPLRQRYPNAQLAVLCQAHVAELFAACPFVHSVICYDRKQVEAHSSERAQILAEIAAFKPDVVLNSVRSRDKFSDELTLAIADAHHIAIEGDLDNITPAERNAVRERYEFLVPTPESRRTELDRHVDFLHGIGVEATRLQPVTWTTADDELLADEFFKAQGLDPQKTIAMFPGAQHEVRVYHGYADALKSLSGYRFLIFGDAGQSALAEEIELQLPGQTVNLCGRSSLRETVALVKRCRLYVGAESAGAHIACAVGVPNVVLLGGGHFARFMPYSPLTSAVSLPLDCFGCNWRCSHKRAHCIKDVAPEIVSEAIRQTLAKVSARPRLFLQPANRWAGGLILPAWKNPTAFAGGTDVEMIEVTTAVTNAQPLSHSQPFAIATCPVCGTDAASGIVKKHHPYHVCPACDCAFTPHIDAAVLQTENNGHSARHDQNQDAIRLQRLNTALGRSAAQVIDFGCGQGETTRFIQSQGICAMGIDQDTELQLKDVAEDSVDGIMMVEVVEHLFEPHAIFSQFNRVLKPGGVVYIESSFVDKKELATWVYLDPAIGHCTVHSLRSMARLAEQNGFAIDWLNPNVCCFTKKVAVAAPEKSLTVTSDAELIGDGILEPIVSVVISTYQSEKFMRACLDNLSRQTIFNQVEVIVVDSGSPENERVIVAEFQQQFPNIRYLRTPRETLYAAWNRGLAIARGRYFANVNTDDSLRHDALEILAASLDKHADCALSYADCAWTTKPNDTFPSAHVTQTVKYPDYAPIETLFYCITGCLQFFRTASLRQLGGFDATLKCAGDYEATLKMMAAHMNAVHVPEVLSLFYQNVTGLTQASNRAALEHDMVMDRYRNSLNLANIFQVDTASRSAKADALAVLGARATCFPVPWESKPIEHLDFAFACFHAALESDPDCQAAGFQLVTLTHKLNRLNTQEAELVSRWPKMREWIASIRLGQCAALPPLKHALLGPVYRATEASQRPTAEQLAREPKALQPWIARIDGRHVYLSEDLFPRAAGLSYTPPELQAAGNRLALLLKELPPFYAHFGGAGDALLLLAAFYDQKPDGVVFSYPNGVGAAKALFDAFPKLSKIYFLPQHTEPFFHIVLRYAVYELKNCLGAGATPRFGYEEEWKASLDVTKKYGIKQAPRWAAAWRQNVGSKKVAVAPKGSLSGMVGSKRNIILPELWPQVVAHITERGFEPVILGLPSEAKDYPALPGCTDARKESFPGQMKVIGECAGLVGADSWAKSFSALAEIPTLVFEPIKGADLISWKDPSDWVFIEPWPSIKMIRSLDEFRDAFDARIAKLAGTEIPPAAKPVVVWEGSFLDYGSLSHINRELTARLPETMCVGPNILPERAKNDAEMKRCAKKLSTSAPKNAAVTVRHQWPPNWSRPESGLLVVIQPWEYGHLPKAWVEQSAKVDEFWVPSPLVRHMYVDSGIAPEKVRVMPNGVDSSKFRPGVKPLALKTRKKFKFLFVGGTIHRKGPDVLLETFAQTFTAKDDVCLVIKDFGGDSCYQGQTAEAAIKTIQQKPDAPEILYLREELSAEQMPALYAACDCLVLPYRGEGFGMPVLEAMSCALPVIVTAGGATDSFASHEAGWKIPAKGQLLGGHVGNIPLAKSGWLLEPSKPHLAATMKFAVAHPEECRKRGAAGRGIVERRFDWNDIAPEISHRLKELAERTPSKTVAAAVPAKPIIIPSVAKVGRLDEARELFAGNDFTSAWNAGVAAIAQRPFHPEAFLLLAETAQAAGDTASARLCADYARKLAPGFELAKKFAKQKSGNGAKPAAFDAAAVIKAQASPRLSVCLITKNEEKFLAQCLKSVRGLATQIVVVDTGSTDRTVEIAREFGAEVYAFTWRDDFAAARNAAIEHAHGDWILILDADEELPAAQHAKLLTDIKNPAVLGFRLPLVNRGQEGEGRSFIPRLFRNAPGVFFHGRIHEQVFPSLLPLCKMWGLKTALGSAELLHHGYTKELVRDRNKVERNLNLLRQAIAENPTDANLLMNLGLELVRSDDLSAGIVKYREAFAVMSAQPAAQIVPELREALLTQFTSQLYKLRQHDEVVQVLTSALADNGGLNASLHLALGLAFFELKRFSEAADQMRQCLAKNQIAALTPINLDIHTAAPWHCLALCQVRMGDLAGAEKSFEEATRANGRANEARVDYAKFLAEQNRAVDALKQLHATITADAQFTSAWRLGGQIALAQTDLLDFALDWTGEAVLNLPDNTILQAQRAEALLLTGHLVDAGGLWQTLWQEDRLPRSLAALILCQVAGGKAPLRPNSPAEEEQTSRAFIGWYQRLISLNAAQTIRQLNAHLPTLAATLPTAGNMLQAAFTEVQAEPAGAA